MKPKQVKAYICATCRALFVATPKNFALARACCTCTRCCAPTNLLGLGHLCNTCRMAEDIERSKRLLAENRRLCDEREKEIELWERQYAKRVRARRSKS